MEDEFFLSHLAALPDNYFDTFSPLEIAEHARLLKSIDSEDPCAILVSEGESGFTKCTILAFDKAGVFSLIAGLLSATGFTIIAGLSFTYSKEILNEKRRIIDHFEGTLKEGITANQWKEIFSEKLISVLKLAGQDDDRSLLKAKQRINEEVVASLADTAAAESVLYPIVIDIRQDTGNKTKLIVTSEDTPFFLYSLSSALALHNISIETVRINTTGTKVEDEFEITDLKGNAITDPGLLNQLKISVIFTKQFTYFLSKAPDPYTALLRFETIIQDVLSVNLPGFWDKLLSDPGIMTDLAQLLGASDFIWEDFIRLQYETILPMLTAETREKEFSHSRPEMEFVFGSIFEKDLPLEETKTLLNEAKDKEIYLIDLDHILNPDRDFLFLSRKLTDLAELVVSAAVAVSLRHYANIHGGPMSFAGIEARWAVLGLGKLGGAAIGYASDIELLFVYSDNGETAGPNIISNSEFFNRMWSDAIGLIEAKRQGIFRVDTRLRPFGSAGPMACSLDNFCRYYGRDGSAHSYELLALIRLRAICGNPALGEQVERLRDDMVYEGNAINLSDLNQLREKQLSEKTVPGRWNAKFNPGALVDLEYTVQILQCQFGKNNVSLRTPRIHVALKELTEAGILSGDEEIRLVHSYHFFRKLINGLRMLRGSADDLFLPGVDSDEYVHLARRMGYRKQKGLSPSQNLHLEFETRTAQVRSFVETHLGRPSAPDLFTGNAADLVLSDSMSPEAAERICMAAGFNDTGRARENLRILAGNFVPEKSVQNVTAQGFQAQTVSGAGPAERRQLFAWLAVLAWDIVKNTPDPDMALNNWERFVRALPSAEAHFGELLSQPKRLEVLLMIFAGSQFLSDTLIRNPDFLEWVSSPERLFSVRTRERMLKELSDFAAGAADSAEFGNRMRLFKKREILRIGTRDICFGIPIEDIVLELSNLAEACLEESLSWFTRGRNLSGDGFCVLAFGKLGGKELNYSSDIDLIGLSASGGEEKWGPVFEETRDLLSAHSEEGYAYRVDLRLRPYGSSGPLVSTTDFLMRYYMKTASLWEYQALIKLRPVAGDMALGRSLIKRLKALLLKSWPREEVASSIRIMRDKAIQAREQSLPGGIDVKADSGGIRDIEFLLQAHQLVHCAAFPEILTGNTMEGLRLLKEKQILPEDAYEELSGHYAYLRRVEHFLQIYEDRQVHALPTAMNELEALAKRMEGSKTPPKAFIEKLSATLISVSRLYKKYMPG